MSGPGARGPGGVAEPPGRAPAKHVDFGHEAVTPNEKTARVAGVFEAVATRYDLMNDLMSLGVHRILKRIAVDSTGLRPGGRVLDLAGGTGDMARLLAPVVGAAGQVVLCDVNAAMLSAGRERLLNAGLAQVAPVRGDAECLPFADAAFDCVVIAFGLRNLTYMERGLREMWRVLRPHGALVVLEFSTPGPRPLRAAQGLVQSLWPLLGRVVAGDAAPYRYLVESIARHPGVAAVTRMLEDAGFAAVRGDRLLGGVVALHRGVK